MKVRFQADADFNAEIIAQTISVRVAIEELLLIWTASESEEWRNLIVELPL